jgi:hypothetical protein
MAYETEFASALDQKVKDYIAASQQGVDPGTRARMAQASAADAAAVEAARVPPGGAPAQGIPKPGLGARLKSFGKAVITPGTYNPSMGTIAKGAWGLGKANAAIAPLMGGIMAAADSQDTVKRVATMTDNPLTGQPLDYNSFFGRLGANAINFLQRTGQAATFGIASRDRMERVMSGGNFFADDPPPAAPVPADMQPDGSRRGTLGEPAAPAASNTVPGTVHPTDGSPVMEMMRAAGLDTRGSVIDESPGDVRTALGKPEAYGGYIEGPNGRIELPSGTVQRFGVRRRTVGDSFNESLAERRAMAKTKLNIEAVEAGARLKSAGKSSAEEEIARAKINAAQAYIRANPTDIGGYISILSGKDPKETQGTIASPTGSTSLVNRDNTVTTTDAQGNVVKRPIFRQPTEGEISTMKANAKDPTYKAAFLRNFGPEAYKTHIERR